MRSCSGSRALLTPPVLYQRYTVRQSKKNRPNNYAISRGCFIPPVVPDSRCAYCLVSIFYYLQNYSIFYCFYVIVNIHVIFIANAPYFVNAQGKRDTLLFFKNLKKRAIAFPGAGMGDRDRSDINQQWSTTMPKPKAKLTKRKIQGKLTRQKIFDTSLELFNKHGYENVTVDEICENIGLSKGAFYTHFKSKDQIILEDFIHLNTYYDEVYQELSTVSYSLGKLFLFQQKAMEQMEKIGYKAVKLVYNAETEPQKKKSFLISKNHSLYKITAELVREAQKKGEIRKDKNAVAITNMVLQVYRGIILDWCLNNGSYSLVKATEQALPMIYGGIKPEKS
jgi:hypothetical protein